MKKIKILVLPILLFFGFLGFGFCDIVLNTDIPGAFDFRIGNNFQGTRDIKEYYGNTSNGLSCIFVTSSNRCSISDGDETYTMTENVSYCTNSNTIILNCTSPVQYYYFTSFGEGLIRHFYPNFTSSECQTEYNLIPIESVDSSYCQSNGLCPSVECSGGVSNLFINDIEHVSAPLIDITIPEEFSWNYTGNDDIFTLDVVGYNTDPDYIAGIINTQKSKPNNQDFNNIVSGIVPLFIPGLVVILFIYFVFRFIKKIF